MSELKRFDLSIGEEVNLHQVAMTLCDNGEWCRYEDVVARFDFYRDRLREHRAAYDALVKQLEEIRRLMLVLAQASRAMGNEALAHHIESVVQQ